MAKIKIAEGGKHSSNPGNEYEFYCPGCKEKHYINDGWQVDLVAVTINPSVRVSRRLHNEDGSFTDETLCHSFVRNGQIQFLEDSKHPLSSQTVDLPEVDGNE